MLNNAFLQQPTDNVNNNSQKKPFSMGALVKRPLYKKAV